MKHWLRSLKLANALSLRFGITANTTAPMPSTKLANLMGIDPASTSIFPQPPA